MTFQTILGKGSISLPNVGESSGMLQHVAQVSRKSVVFRRVFSFGAVHKCANRVDLEEC